ncbi:MAG TPA: aspartyl/asparaginyl beta-hydroxylase domain-containing protein [Luteimonas sp.]|nr:aspartyl/asparaginyl beta-hydroxylase domain-containing protein [Luteimonas sp.]
MKLQFPFIQLPLRFDAAALAAEVAAIDEACWLPHPQQFEGNSMLPLVAVDGEPANESFAGPMRPTPHLLACPYLMQVVASLGVTAGRSRLMRLSGHAEVTRHVDQGYYWAERVRVHVPIVTQPTVRFECGGATVNMAAGECWIFDTWRLHNVVNDAVQSRIHLVVDTVGGDGFWDLVAEGRPFPAQAGAEGWQPRLVAPRAGPAPTLACEAVNVPAVMSPWELNAQFAMIFADAVPHPQLARVQELAGRLVRSWRSLWAQYGDAPQGRPRFRALVERFLADTDLPGPPLMLRNAVQLHGVLILRIGQAAVADDDGAVAMPAASADAVADRG